MLAAARPGRRSYDPRVKKVAIQLPCAIARDELGIPRTTHASWLARGLPEVVSLDDAATDEALARAEERALRAEREVRKLRAFLRLLTSVMLALGVSLESVRVPAGPDKDRILRAVHKAAAFVPKNAKRRLLTWIGLTPARYREWTGRAKLCLLDDAPSCPRSRPTRLTFAERIAMKTLLLAEEFRHFSVHARKFFAAREDLVHASYGSWLHLMKATGLVRPRNRVHPRKPRAGLRASTPAEWLHVDVSVLRLLDGTKVYIQGVVDNFSRRILAFAVTSSIGGEETKAMLLRAIAEIPAGVVPKLMTDDGTENCIIAKDFSLKSAFEHIVAQIDIPQSNSMVESFWSHLKHRWLFLHTLDSIATVRRLVTKYVEDHNLKIPAPVLGGRTPDEAYFGKNEGLVVELKSAHAAAREARIEEKRAARCNACSPRSRAGMAPEPPSGCVR